MKLKLKYQDTPQRSTSAAFLRSNDPTAWLQEIDRWEIPHSQLECYIVPASKSSVAGTGLLVVFKNKKAPENLDHNNAYGLLGKRLFLPIYATLTPQVTEGELEKLLLYHRNFFHPTIGLVGFEDTDQLDLADLLIIDNNINTNWTFAQKGNHITTKLHRIKVPRTTPETLLDALRGDMENRPLDELGEGEGKEATAFDKFLNDVSRFGLKGALSISGGLGNVLGNLNFGDAPPGGGSMEPGFLGRFEQWANDQLKELERKQKKEIDRLKDLFDEDLDEALKYAIPLDDKYHGRGMAPPSGWLSRRSTDFSLGGLGGGRPVDGWNIGDDYFKLRQKYQDAARKKMEEGDFRKAAYIYAHLLGDFHSAANALKQGKYFREAAAIYKDHLKNMQGAAECLEEGGLLFEAIELYKELKAHEKIGDLYTQLEEYEKAEDFFQQTIDIKLANDDYLDAVRVMEKKLNDGDIARKTLLEGWTKSRQSENCLKKYFSDKIRSGEEDTAEQIVDIFKERTPHGKKDSFLNVLLHLNKRHQDAGISETSQQIVYEILSEQADRGIFNRLAILNGFVKGDRLISSDVSRFIHLKKATRKKQKKEARQLQYKLISKFQIDQSVEWIAATGLLNQFLALGRKNGYMNLVRGKWEHHMDYYSWENQVTGYPENYHFIASPFNNNYIFIETAGEIPLDRKHLPANEYFFEDLILERPSWLPDAALAVSLDKRNEVITLVLQGAVLKLDHYNTAGILQGSQDCKIDGNHPMVANRGIQQMYLRRNHFYFINGEFFFRIDQNGSFNAVHLEAKAQKLVATNYLAANKMVISTDQGCLLFHPDLRNINQTGGFFAEDVEVVDMLFLSRNQLAVAGSKKVEIYDTSITNATPGLLGKIYTNDEIVGLLQPPKRDRVAVLTKAGNVLLYQI